MRRSSAAPSRRYRENAPSPAVVVRVFSPAGAGIAGCDSSSAPATTLSGGTHEERCSATTRGARAMASARSGTPVPASQLSHGGSRKATSNPLPARRNRGSSRSTSATTTLKVSTARRSAFRSINRAIRGERSTNTHSRAPREIASKPSVPTPAQTSSTRAPTSSSASTVKRLFLSLTAVGRAPSGAAPRRPPGRGGPVSTRPASDPPAIRTLNAEPPTFPPEPGSSRAPSPFPRSHHARFPARS